MNPAPEAKVSQEIQSSSPEKPANHTDTDAKCRSCFACYARKIRCDRVEPCSSCTKNKIRCIYPAPDKDPSNLTSRRHLLAEIVGRLDRIESKIMGSGTGSLIEETSLALVPKHVEKRVSRQYTHESDPPATKRHMLERSIPRQTSWELLVGDGGMTGKYLNNPVLANLFEDVSKPSTPHAS